jgi:hypothetical protein
MASPSRAALDSRQQWSPLRSRQRARTCAPLLKLTDLMDELIQNVFPDALSDAVRASGTCRTFYRLFKRDAVARRLVLPDRPMRSPSELAVLQHLANAGNAAARFRLAIACVYESTKDDGYEEGLRMLRSIAEPGQLSEVDPGLVGDALFEIWHLTRNGGERDNLLRRAAAVGHVASLIELHGTSRERLQTICLTRPLEADVVFSPAWLAATFQLLANPSAADDRLNKTQFRHYCDRPGCVRWRFRKKEVRRREAAGLSPAPYIRLWKCGRCRYACYCSKACQTLAWPKPHRDECDRLLGLVEHPVEPILGVHPVDATPPA